MTQRRQFFSAMAAMAALPAVAPAGTVERKPPAAYITIAVVGDSEVLTQDILDVLAEKIRSSIVPLPEATTMGVEAYTTRVSVGGITRTYKRTLSVQGEVRLSTDR